MLRVWAVSHHPSSAHTRAYGNTWLWSFLVDLGSNRHCLTLEWHMVTLQDGYGHVDENSTILQTCPSSLSAMF